LVRKSLFLLASASGFRHSKSLKQLIIGLSVKKDTQVNALFICFYGSLLSFCRRCISFFFEVINDVEWLISHRFFCYASVFNRYEYNLYENKLNVQLKKQSLTGSTKNIVLVPSKAKDKSVKDRPVIDGSVSSNYKQVEDGQLEDGRFKHSQLKHSQLKHSQLKHSQLKHSQLKHSQLKHAQLTSIKNNKAVIDNSDSINNPDSINKADSINLIAAGIAHEMNNPLGFVSSNLMTLQEYAESLKKILMQQQYIIERLSTQKTLSIIEIMALDNDDEINYILGDVENLINESMTGIARVQNIIEDLSEVSPFELLDTSDEDVNKVLDSILCKLDMSLSQNIQLVKDYDELLTTKVSTNKLNQAFLAIINNAVQAVHARGNEVKGEIILRTTQLQRHIRIDVIDNGCGIPEEKLTTIFNPFYTTRNVGEGIGLGLHMAKNVAESHGGALSVSSRVGMGTVFTVILPVGNGRVDASDWPMDTQMSL